MRPAFLVLSLIAPATLAQVSDPAPAIIEGRVVSATTGQPLRKARVELIPYRETSIQGGMAISDDAGKFRLENIPPGSYQIVVNRTGYVAQRARRLNGRSSVLKLGAGQHVDDVLINLAPQGVIAGYVFDEDGDPFRNSDVTLFRESRASTRTQLVRTGHVNTDMEGHFVFAGLAAGRYYMGASGQPQIFSFPQSPSREPQENYVLTYYPSSLDSAGAVAVDIMPGGEFRSAEIRLRKARTYRISGKIVNPPANLQSFALRLVAADTNEEPFGPITQLRRDSFEFNNVQPGSYLIRTTDLQSFNEKTGERRSVPLFCRFPITVRDEDLSDIKIEFQPGVHVVGTVKVEGDGRLESTPTITFLVLGRYDYDHSTQLDASGGFELSNLAPDRHHVILSPLPKGTYLKSIRAGGQEIPPDSLNLTGGDPGPIEMVLSPGAAEVSGTVRDDKGETIPSTSVALWSKGDRPPAFGTTDENGAFQLGSLPPGEYFIAAAEGGDLSNADVRKSVEGSATTLALREGSHEAVDLTLKP
jgi:protocatechuate 3,4-dioxygenase beta subunit